MQSGGGCGLAALRFGIYGLIFARQGLVRFDVGGKRCLAVGFQQLTVRIHIESQRADAVFADAESFDMDPIRPFDGFPGLEPASGSHQGFTNGRIDLAQDENFGRSVRQAGLFDLAVVQNQGRIRRKPASQISKNVVMDGFRGTVINQ